MSTTFGEDAWNKHAWRRDTGWWDGLEVDKSELASTQTDVFEWLEKVAPDPYEHDYILYTDGSGCSSGWGGYAAVWEQVDLVGEHRQPVDSGVYVAGTYGSTVLRSELNALLDGTHAILTHSSRELQETAKSTNDGDLVYRIGAQGILQQFTGPERISILWYTDRRGLAEALLSDTEGNFLSSRAKERDLWLRWSSMAKYVCITPMLRARNVVPGQAMCDALAGNSRALLKGAVESLSQITSNIYNIQSWHKAKPQTALF